MWTLLTDTKKSCFRSWLIFTAVGMLWMLLQTWSGKLQDMLGLAWAWYFLCVAGGGSILWWSVLRDQQSSMLLSRTAARSLKWATWTYGLLLLLSLLAETSATRGPLSIADYRLQSLLWLLPVQLLLGGAYVSVFWSKRSRLFQKLPLSVVAEQEADHWGQMQQSLKKESLQLIAQAQTSKAMQRLAEHLKRTGIGDLSTLVLLQSQWQDNERKRRQALLTEEEAQRNSNRLNVALMALIRTL